MADFSVTSQISQHLENLKAGGNILAPSRTSLGAPQQFLPPMQAPPMYGASPAQQPTLRAQVQIGQPAQLGQLMSPAVLSIAIDNIACRYQLSEADLRETFQRWGSLHAVHVYREGSREVGVINFADPIDASDAQRQLNGVACNFDGYPGTLVVVPGNPERLSPPVQRPALAGSLPKGSVAVPPSELMMPPGGVNGCAGGQRPPAWSCKIVVQAESLHPSFPTAQKINGVNNANVEHVRAQTSCMVQLRGQKSGYFEPETGQELLEPMAMWLAHDDARIGQSTCEMVQDLLKSVYDEHQQWCTTNGHQPLPGPLEPQVHYGVMNGSSASPSGTVGQPPGLIMAPGVMGGGQSISPGLGQQNIGHGPCAALGQTMSGIAPGAGMMAGLSMCSDPSQASMSAGPGMPCGKGKMLSAPGMIGGLHQGMVATGPSGLGSNAPEWGGKRGKGSYKPY